MNSTWIKILSAFIPGRRRRWAFRNRLTANVLSATNDIRIDRKDAGRCRLSISGKNNVVHVGKLRPGKGELDVRIFGDGNEVVIGDGVSVAQFLRVVVGQNHPNFGPVEKCRISIGGRTGFQSAQCVTYNSGAAVEIGSDCMFSCGITLYQTDGHPVLDLESRRVVNRAGTLRVGDHVWVGAHAALLKNSLVADDCIVGFGSVVSGKFDRSHCAIAGNPARVVTKPGRDVTWCRGDPDYVRNGLSAKEDRA